MPTPPSNIELHAKAYAKWLTAHNFAEITVKDYVYAIRKCMRDLQTAGHSYTPTTIREEDVSFLLQLWNHKAVGTVKVEIAIVGKWLERMGKNPVVSNMDLMWPSYVQKGTSPLPPTVCFGLTANLVEEERIIVHLMLFLGFRMIEVRRAVISDIEWNDKRMLVHGKGHRGGKLRWVSFHNTTGTELLHWLQIRESRIMEYNINNTTPEPIPNNLVIYYHPKKKVIGAYGKTAMENTIRRVAEKTGVNFSAHSLRKSFARNMWLAGVKIEIIASLLGHVDVKTTMKYLGIAQDDQINAQNQLAMFQANIGMKEVKEQ